MGKHIVITGGTGFIGRHLVAMLVASLPDCRITILTRNPSRYIASCLQVEYAYWNVAQQEIERGIMEDAHVIIHLAGAGIADKRWTAVRKKEILDSRTKSGALLVKYARQYGRQLECVIGASAIGYYGADHSGQQPFVEKDTPAKGDFLAQVCGQWEDSLRPLMALVKRVVWIRTGIVLSPESGLLARLISPLKWYVAPILGSGKSMVSWVGIEDLCRMYLFAITQTDMSGAYNAVAPHPLPMETLVRTLKEKIQPKAVTVKVPVAILKLAVGELADDLCKSITVSSSRIQKAGFRFTHSRLADYLDNNL